MKFVPREYQRKAIRHLLEHQHAGLFIEPGLGKTSCVLAAFKVLRQRGMVGRMLVVAPLRVCYAVWPKEAVKWDEFRGLRVRVLHGDAKDLSADADVYVVNPEGLGWLFVELAGRREWPFEWLVVDESTRFKHTNTQRFKLLRNHLGRFMRRTILTGTPTPNGMMDLFGQMYVADCGRSLGRYVTHFRNQFFYQSGYGGYEWRLQPGAEAEIMRRIDGTVLAMVADDWLELPERVNSTIEVDLPEGARRVYRELERELVAELGGNKTLVAASAGVASLKCRQLANGGVYYERETPRGTVRAAEHVHDAKVDALEGLVEQLQGSPVLVAYEFEHDLERIRRRLGQKTPAFRGRMPPREAARLEAAWNAGDLPVLLAQPQSVAHGLNLQEGSGHTVCWFGMIWDYEVYDQFVKRVLRSGQRSRRVVVHHIVARGTVDEDVYAAVVDGKRLSQASFMKAIKERTSRG